MDLPLASRLGPLLCILACGLLAACHAPPAGASARFAARGRVVLDSPDVLVFSPSGGRVYSCVRTSGHVYRVTHANASAAGFLAAGRYLAFTYAGGGEPHLDVFAAASGTTVLDVNLHAGCGPVNSPCVAVLGGFQLAPSGWVAEYGASGTVTATDGPSATVELDHEPGLAGAHLHLANANGVDLAEGTGSTLSWTAASAGGLYSTPLTGTLARLATASLEKGAVRAAAPSSSVCALFDPAEARAVLGAAMRSSSGDSCSYAMSGTPASTLTITLAPNLTAAQVLAAKQATYAQATSPLLSGPWPGAPEYTRNLWHVSWDSGNGGASGAQSQAVEIIGDTELTVQLATRPTSDATGYQVGSSRCWETDEAVEHVADLAFDRLMGVPVSYRSGPPVHSCAKQDEGF